MRIPMRSPSSEPAVRNVWSDPVAELRVDRPSAPATVADARARIDGNAGSPGRDRNDSGRSVASAAAALETEPRTKRVADGDEMPRPGVHSRRHGRRLLGRGVRPWGSQGHRTRTPWRHAGTARPEAQECARRSWRSRPWQSQGRPRRRSRDASRTSAGGAQGARQGQVHQGEVPVAGSSRAPPPAA